jgi:hypothetical protein
MNKMGVKPRTYKRVDHLARRLHGADDAAARDESADSHALQQHFVRPFVVSQSHLVPQRGFQHAKLLRELVLQREEKKTNIRT